MIFILKAFLSDMKHVKAALPNMAVLRISLFQGMQMYSYIMEDYSSGKKDAIIILVSCN
jgi:hypothetical protein